MTIATMLDLLLDAPPRLWIGTLFFSLILAIVTSLAYRSLGRRVTDPSTVLTGLFLVMNLLALILGASYMKSKEAQKQREVVELSSLPPFGPYASNPPLSIRFFEVADADRDGRVTPEEAASWVRSSLPEGEDSLDAQAFRRAFRRDPDPALPLVVKEGFRPTRHPDTAGMSRMIDD